MLPKTGNPKEPLLALNIWNTSFRILKGLQENDLGHFPYRVDGKCISQAYTAMYLRGDAL